MKKLFILLSLPLMAFQCEVEPITNSCNCVHEVVWPNNVIDTVLIEKTTAPSYKCEQWGLGLEYQPIPNSDFLSRYICE